MRILKDISGQQFGKLLVLHRDPNKMGTKNSCWICKCECGVIKSIYSSNLESGQSKTCGCEKYIRTHGMTGTLTYRIWINMCYRCNNPNNNRWDDYGGRGIKVCKRWEFFENFLEDMGEAPPGYSIERLDNDKNYEKSNCVWILSQDQSKNRRSNILDYEKAQEIRKLYKAGGYTYQQLADKYGCSRVSIKKVLSGEYWNRPTTIYVKP